MPEEKAGANTQARAKLGQGIYGGCFEEVEGAGEMRLAA